MLELQTQCKPACFLLAITYMRLAGSRDHLQRQTGSCSQLSNRAAMNRRGRQVQTVQVALSQRLFGNNKQLVPTPPTCRPKSRTSLEKRMAQRAYTLQIRSLSSRKALTTRSTMAPMNTSSRMSSLNLFFPLVQGKVFIASVHSDG